MISADLWGRFGNHLWIYAVTRTIAEQRNYQYHIPRNFLGNTVFDANLGTEDCVVHQIYKESSGLDQVYNPAIFGIPDYTRLDGYFQSEKYIINNKKNIQDWFTIKNPNTELVNQLLDDNTCVIHYRGEDYKDLAEIYLPKEYYDNAMNYMKSMNSSMKFIFVTNDVEETQKVFPNYSVYRFTEKDDFYLLNQAKYLIIPNSTFSWWAAWLSDRLRFIIAPKYWFRYNADNGWWAGQDIITTGWHYLGKSGILQNSNECNREQIGQDPINSPWRR